MTHLRIRCADALATEYTYDTLHVPGTTFNIGTNDKNTVQMADKSCCLKPFCQPISWDEDAQEWILQFMRDERVRLMLNQVPWPDYMERPEHGPILPTEVLVATGFATKAGDCWQLRLKPFMSGSIAFVHDDGFEHITVEFSFEEPPTT